MKHRRRRIEPTVATHFPSLSKSFDLNQNVYMFVEDVHLAVMPIGGRSEKHKDFSVAVEGGNDECEKARQLLRSIDRDTGHDDNELVSDAVEEIARYLAWEGSAVFEILRAGNGETDLHGFTTKRLIRLPGYYVQLIPSGDWQLWKKRYVLIPASRIWEVQMPKSFGGRSGYRRTLAALERFEHLGPRFWRRDLEAGTSTQDFDFQEYVRNSEIYYGQTTKVWGWNRRDWSQERSTEYFTFYKIVTFRWAQALLREHIIRELNQLLYRLGVKCAIKVLGLPTAQEILQIRQEMEAGKLTFGAAIDSVSI